MKYTVHVGVLAVSAVIIAGGSFFGGMQYKAHTVSAGGAARFQGDRAAGGMPGGMPGGRTAGAAFGGATTGEILAKDEKSITVKGRDGGSKIVYLSGKTQVLKSAEGTADDLAIGTQVVVMGTPNSDGSVTAESVQIRPAAPAAPATP